MNLETIPPQKQVVERLEQKSTSRISVKASYRGFWSSKAKSEVAESPGRQISSQERPPILKRLFARTAKKRSGTERTVTKDGRPPQGYRDVSADFPARKQPPNKNSARPAHPCCVLIAVGHKCRERRAAFPPQRE